MIRKIYGHKDMEKLEDLLNRSLIDSKEIAVEVEEILQYVESDGDRALLDLTHRFDQNQIKSLRVTREEVESAHVNIDKALKNALEKAIGNIKKYHENQVQTGFTMEEEGIFLGQMVHPIERVGVYIPGGTASYPSTVMMNVIPANIAGVKEIIMVTPADKNGQVKDSVLVTADLLGVNEIYKIGGAQAIAALAYGTQTIPRVDKIVGPGNIYVAMAKRQVSGLVGIDMIAGPSEIVVIADKTGNPKYIAADLIGQAEHDERAAAIVITDREDLGEKIISQIQVQLQTLDRKEIIEKSLKDYGAIILVEDMKEAFRIVNRLAPEHLEIQTDQPFEDYKHIKNAGAIFLGQYSPEALGDYYGGTNHTLPTLRTARFSSPLGVYDFVKKTSLLYYSREALTAVGNDVILIANDEGLTGHGNSIKVRMED